MRVIVRFTGWVMSQEELVLGTGKIGMKVSVIGWDIVGLHGRLVLGLVL